MSAEIAVFLGLNGKTATLYEEGRIVVYARNMGKWQEARYMEFTLKTIKGMVDLRRRMEEVLEFMAGCKIFVGRSITGIPYYFLEKARCSIWECEGQPVEFLDFILHKEEAASRKLVKQKRKAPGIHTGFKEISPGNYKISLKAIQENNTLVTTKQVLQPFLRRISFHSLEVTCSHIPLWLEGELLAGNLTMNSEEKAPNEIMLLITRTAERS